MATKISEPVPIEIMPGVQPSTDMTPARTQHYTDSLAVRFVNGIPQKIGGNLVVTFNYSATVSGTIRSITTAVISGKNYTLLGTNEKLYGVIGSALTNITPFQTVSVAVANSLATQYNTLGGDPFSATLGSPTLTVTDSDGANRLKVGDTVTYAGSGDVAGIAAVSINAAQIVRSIDTGSGTYTINVGANATSTASGGGAAVVRKTGLLNLTKVAHGQANGDRVKISGAGDTGGILAAAINLQFIIRNVAANSFDFMTASTATSSVTAAGGAGTVYYPEIPDGNLNETATQGYGAGLYGVGLYGTALVSSSARSLPRIWFFDRYANTFVMTPGNQTGVYQWFGATSTAPALVSGAPTAVNYIFVSNNILVTLGAAGTENRIFASDQDDITDWTSSSTNQVYDDDVEGAGRLLSHCPAENLNLLFTENQTYTFRYIGLPLVWEILQLDETIGIIAPMARVPVKGLAVWMGQNNFYLYRGGKVEVIPANSQSQSTALNYVFGNLNYGQKSKIFAWFNPQFNEVWFHYPSAASNECDSVVRVNMLDYTWTIDQWDRTAAEWPAISFVNPLLANVGILYKHEIGTDDNGAALPFSLTGNRMYKGKDNVVLSGVIPDSEQEGDITFNAKGYRFPQSASTTYDLDYTVSADTEQIPMTSAARFYEYTWSGSELGQSWQMGQWFESLQKGPTQ